VGNAARSQRGGMATGALASPGSLVIVGRFSGQVVVGTVVCANDEPPNALHAHGWVWHESIVAAPHHAGVRVAIGTSLRLEERDIICAA
jgi:hypothetical protein